MAKHTIPKIIFINKIGKLIVSGLSENAGKISAAPNHPADKLANTSEAVDKNSGSNFFR